MKKIIELWNKFIEDWKNNPENLVKNSEDYPCMVKPQFYDFMNWVSKKNKKNHVSQ